jgi:hypothetical protein
MPSIILGNRLVIFLASLEAKGLVTVDGYLYTIKLKDSVALLYSPIYPLAKPKLVVL